MDTHQYAALRELHAVVIYADMMEAELEALRPANESVDQLSDTATWLILRAGNLYRKVVEPEHMVEHHDLYQLVGDLRRQLAEVRQQLRQGGQPPRQADVEMMLRVASVDGAGFIPSGMVWRHLQRLHSYWMAAVAV
jgi:hypothetical protein